MRRFWVHATWLQYLEVSGVPAFLQDWSLPENLDASKLVRLTQQFCEFSLTNNSAHSIWELQDKKKKRLDLWHPSSPPSSSSHELVG